MNARLLLAAVLGAALGVTAVSLNPLHSAPAPNPKPQGSEYKVVRFFGGTARDTPDKLTDALNALTKDGWEYAGPVAPAEPGAGEYVAFRRSKP